MTGRFAFARAHPLVGWLFALLGMGSRRIGTELVETSEGPVLRVRMGWAFRAEIPVVAITAATATNGQVWGWGVHGFGGRWLVNTTGTGLVILQIDPAVRSWAVGFPVRLRWLELSLADRDAFLAALGRPAG